jgi:WD40 repeat protein
MDFMNNHHREQDAFSNNERLPHLPSVHAPDSLLPDLLARLERTAQRISEQASVEECLDALNDPSWQVRTAAMQRLENSQRKDVPVEPLLAALNDEDVSVRAAAIRAVGSLGQQAPLAPLVVALHDPHWLVREAAALTLGTLGKRVPDEPLEIALRDDNIFVCRAAALALVQTHRAAAPVLHHGTSAQKRNRLKFPHRFIQASLAAILVIAGVLFAWLPHAQPPSSSPGMAHNAPGGTVLFTYQGGLGVEGSPVWSSESNSLALLSSFGYSVQVWNIATGNLVQNPLLPLPYLGPATASAWSWSPDGKLLAVTSADANSGDARVQVWDATTGRNTMNVFGHDNGFLHIAWSLYGQRIAIVGSDGVVQVWNPYSGHQLLTLAGHPGGTHQLFWSAFDRFDNQFLLLSSSDGTYQLWNTVTGAPLSAFHGEIAEHAALSPDGLLLVTSNAQGTLSVWNTFTGHELTTYQGFANNQESSGRASLLEWSSESRRILAANGSEVRVWDALSGQTLLSFPNPTIENYGQIAPQSVSGFSPNESEVQVWDPIAGQVLLGFSNPTSSRAWEISPDGQYIAFGSWNGGVRVWNVATRHEVAVYQSHVGHVQILAWSPNSQQLAYASTDGNVFVQNVVSGTGAVTYKNLAHIASLTWSPDSKLIAAISRENNMQVLQVT